MERLGVTHAVWRTLPLGEGVFYRPCGKLDLFCRPAIGNGHPQGAYHWAVYFAGTRALVREGFVDGPRSARVAADLEAARVELLIRRQRSRAMACPVRIAA